MAKCRLCRDGYDAEMVIARVCHWCRDKKKFASFAKSCGLTCYPDPTGERCVYQLDGECAGKKSECVHLIDELWNALVKAKGDDDGLLLGKEG